MAGKTTKKPGEVLAVDRDYIAKRNAHFMAQPRAKRASLIAQDVLTQLKENTLIANTGSYVAVAKTERVKETSLQILMEQQAVKCTACAIGATFLSCVRYVNDLEVSEEAIDWWGRVYTIENDVSAGFAGMIDKLKLAFTELELYAMEYCFEQERIGQNLTGEQREVVQESAIYRRCAEAHYDASRLQLVMQHVIKNSGRFVVKGLSLAPNNPNKE